MRTNLSIVLVAGLLFACGGDKKSANNKKVVSGNGGGVTKSGNPQAAEPAADPAPKLAGPHRAAFSFNDNRLSAHVQRGKSLVAAGGSAQFVKYMRFRDQSRDWDIKQRRDNRPVALLKGSSAAFTVPLLGEQINEARIAFRVNTQAKAAIDIQINGDEKNKVRGQLVEGWSVAHFAIPPSLLKAGENEIRIFVGKGANLALDWVALGPDAPESEPAEKDFAQFARPDGVLNIPRDGALAYYAYVPTGAKVVGTISDGCSAQVTATTDAGKTASGTLKGNAGAIDLSAIEASPARIEFRVIDCERAQVSHASLMVPGEPVAFDRAKLTAKPKYVVLWIMDSLRAKAVRPFNPNARAETPTFERLASEAAVFLQAYPHGNESKASHGSFWTSTYPATHRYFDKTEQLTSDGRKLDKVAKDAGLYAVGVSGNGYVIGRRGFGDSWDQFSNYIHEKKRPLGEDLMNKALSWVGSKKEPWLLYLGTIDTHVTWRAKEPWMSKYAPAGYTGKFEKSAGDPLVLKVTEPRDIEHIRAMYDSNVSYQDDLLGQFIKKLEDAGIADDTMLVVTADHGDELWEDGRVGHATSLDETVTHVPFVIRYKPLFPAGMVHGAVGGVDILPTIADALGQKADESWQGESLIALANGVGADYPRMAWASRYETAHAARIGSWKLQHGAYGRALYNLDEDPDEKSDIGEASPIARRFVSDPMWLMRAYNKEWRSARWGNAANVSSRFAADLGE